MPSRKTKVPVTDLEGDGDCYESAARLLLWGRGADGGIPENAVLCHGVVTGQGPVAGLRFGHAWVESCVDLGGSVLEMAIDHSGGKRVALPKDFYYRIGGIDRDETKTYTRDEARKSLLKHRHYGPWD